jgi:hypothetical protein
VSEKEEAAPKEVKALPAPIEVIAARQAIEDHCQDPFTPREASRSNLFDPDPILSTKAPASKDLDRWTISDWHGINIASISNGISIIE